MSKRILLISYVATMASTPNGRTMQSLLQGIPSKDISLFCCYGVPDVGSCASCFKVSNKHALKSIIMPSKSGEEIKTDEFGEAKTYILKDVRKGRKKAWKYLLKEFIWALGRWKNRKLKTWLRDQRADCIVFMYSDNAALQSFAIYAANFLNIPLLVYSCEDYCLKDYNYIDERANSIAFKLYQHRSQKATKKLFERANGLITNADQLGAEYHKKYGIDNISTVMMASNMPFEEHSSVKPMEDLHIDYLGAIGKYRLQAFLDIGEALQDIDPRLKLHIYGHIQDEEIRNQIDGCAGLEYKGFVTYEEVQSIMRSSALLIETISDDPYIRRDKRFGFSTKYADCFACGTPFLVYAPPDIIETRFALENNCAFVATCKNDLKQIIQIALFDEMARKKQISKAKEVTQKYFNKSKNILIVEDMLNSICENK